MKMLQLGGYGAEQQYLRSPKYKTTIAVDKLNAYENFFKLFFKSVNLARIHHGQSN